MIECSIFQKLRTFVYFSKLAELNVIDFIKCFQLDEGLGNHQVVIELDNAIFCQ